jgi:hypothetical protein
MPTAEARVATDRASRYLVQLCRHADQMAGMRHRPPALHGGRRPPAVQYVEHSDSHGIVHFATGRWTLDADPDALTLRAEAADEQTLRRLQDGITARLERIGRRDQLVVTWQRPQAPTDTPGDNNPGPATGKHPRRRWLAATGLVAGGAVVIAVHLGLFGGALAASAWTTWATNVLLLLVVLKVAFMIGHIVLGRFALRRGRAAHARWKRRHSPPEPVARSTTGHDHV